MSDRVSTMTVGEMVAADFRTAAIFERFGIDFCCGGRRDLKDACRTAAADPVDVVCAIEALAPSADNDVDVAQWSLDRLIDHIVSTHHGYVRSSMPIIQRYLARLTEAHGAPHAELTRVAKCFDTLARDLGQHMIKEEQVLFPYVRELAATAMDGRHLPSPFGTVENPIRMMEREHREAADQLRLIAGLTNGYVAPADGCATYRICMAELERFEHDLYKHVHLENNILFPKAVALENGHHAG
jgi:regulator of cell morphogenesis and NO signaling